MWTRAVRAEDYGGHPAKANFQNRGPIDPLTDVGAEQFVRMTADLTAAARTAPFAILTILLTPNGYPPVVEIAHMATGVRLTPYEGDAAPTGFPSVTRNGTSDVSVTFSPSYFDAFGVPGAFSITHATGSAIYESVARVVCERVSATVLRIRVFNEADAPITEVNPGPPELPPVPGVLRVSVMVF